jgi:PTS system mannose-specific IID component
VTIGAIDWVRIFIRSFFLQGLWTDQRGQNLGCVFSLWPVFSRLHKTPESRARVACDHTQFFSTHPYTAGIILGMMAGLEVDHSEHGRPTRQDILTARKVMSGPLAAMGEAFFWSTWRPLCLVGACAVVLVRPTAVLLLPLLFLGAYNLFHLVARGRGLSLGYRWRSEIVSQLSTFQVQRWLVGGAALGILGVCGVVGAAWRVRLMPLWSVGAALGFLLLLRKGISPLGCFLLGGAVALSWGEMGL